MLKAFFILKILSFLSWLFAYVEKLLDTQGKASFKMYDVTGWTTNNYNTHSAQYLKK